MVLPDLAQRNLLRLSDRGGECEPIGHWSRAMRTAGHGALVVLRIAARLSSIWLKTWFSVWVKHTMDAMVCIKSSEWLSGLEPVHAGVRLRVRIPMSANIVFAILASIVI